MPLVLLPAFKSYIGVSGSSQDDRLTMYLAGAEAAVKQYCGRDFESQAYSQMYTGNNTQKLVLRQTPVTAVASVHLDGNGYFGHGAGSPFNAGTLLVDGTDYVLDWDVTATKSVSGILFRIGTVWPWLARVATLNRLTPYQGPNFGNIKVVYTAGYPTVPGDVQAAVCQLGAYLRKMAKQGGQPYKSERIGQYAYEVLVTDKVQLGDTVALLAPYKELGW